MKLCILGATGATGLPLVKQALQNGHQVTAFVRRQGDLPQHENLKVVIAELDNHAALVEALTGQDAVISCLGAALNLKNILQTSFMQELFPDLIAALHDAKLNRVIVLSAIGVGDSLAKASLPARIGYRTVMAALFTDKTKAERILKASDLDWTLVYAPVLTKGEVTGNLKQQKLEDIHSIPSLPKTSHANVAAVLLQIAEQGEWSRDTVVVIPN